MVTVPRVFWKWLKKQLGSTLIRKLLITTKEAVVGEGGAGFERLEANSKRPQTRIRSGSQMGSGKNKKCFPWLPFKKTSTLSVVTNHSECRQIEGQFRAAGGGGGSGSALLEFGFSRLGYTPRLSELSRRLVLLEPKARRCAAQLERKECNVSK